MGVTFRPLMPPIFPLNRSLAPKTLFSKNIFHRFEDHVLNGFHSVGAFAPYGLKAKAARGVCESVAKEMLPNNWKTSNCSIWEPFTKMHRIGRWWLAKMHRNIDVEFKLFTLLIHLHGRTILNFRHADLWPSADHQLTLSWPSDGSQSTVGVEGESKLRGARPSAQLAPSVLPALRVHSSSKKVYAFQKINARKR